MPAFTTAFNNATGALTVTGTADTDGILIGEGGTPGNYGVAELDGVTGNVQFTGVKSIAVDMKGAPAGADDTLSLVGSGGPSTFLPGMLSVTTSGALTLEFGDNWNVAGAVNIACTMGNLNVQTRSGSFSRASNMTLGPTTITHGGTGFTQVLLVSDNTASNTVAINGALSLNMSAGNNILALQGISISGGLTEIGNGASASLTITSTTVGGFVSLNGRAAGAGITAHVSGSKIGTFFSVASGNGDDTVTVDGTSVLGLGLQPQQQTFGVDLKGGTNTSKIGTQGARANNLIHGSLFHFGAGTEDFELQNYTVTSFVTVNAQSGNAGISANISASKISSFLSFAAVGASDDVVSVNNLSIGQNFALDLGGGSNTTFITNNTYLGSYSQIDTGDDTIVFAANTGFGDVRWSGTRLSIGALSFFNDQIAGNATFTSTSSGANDAINLGIPLGTVPDGTNTVAIGKALTIDVGSGSSDTVVLNNVTVKGDVVVNATAAAAETLTITNTAVGGGLSVNAGGSTAAVTVNFGTTATDNTGPLSVVGNVTMTVGAGNDTVSLTDVTIFGATTITTNGGSDTVNLEAMGGQSGPSQFYGAAIVRTGTESDAVVVGTRPLNSLDRAGNPARFYRSVLFDGGDGADTLTETAPQYFGGPPTKENIP